MLETITQFLGEYTPVTTIYESVLEDGTVYSYEAVAAGAAGVDWPWIFSAIFLIVIFYCLFRLLGGVLRG